MLNGANVVSIKSLWKVFGKNPERVLTADTTDLDKAEVLNRLGCVLALQDATFDVGNGETFVVMGLSGSGKSHLGTVFDSAYRADRRGNSH